MRTHVAIVNLRGTDAVRNRVPRRGVVSHIVGHLSCAPIQGLAVAQYIGGDQIGFTPGRRAGVFHKYQRCDAMARWWWWCSKLHEGEAWTLGGIERTRLITLLAYDRPRRDTETIQQPRRDPLESREEIPADVIIVLSDSRDRCSMIFRDRSVPPSLTCN